MGLRAVGIETIWANEKSESACLLYERNIGPGVMRRGDVRGVADFPDCDVLVGCYPCQGYSQGGRRRNDDGINFLYQEFDRALRKIKPRAFIVENVDGMRFAHNRPLLDNQLTRFRLAGYRVDFRILDARDFGLAQERRRLFLVGVRTGEGFRYRFPDPTHGEGRSGGPYRTLRDVIWEHRDAPPGSYNAQPFHWYYLSRDRHRGWEQQAPCIVAHWRHVGLHPDSPPLVKLGPDRWTFVGSPGKARRLSYIECAALQGFPDPRAFDASSVSAALRFRAIGNAVPPPLFGAVAGALADQLESRSSRRNPGSTILMSSS